MEQTTIHFSQVRLAQRDGHKLRGYFSKLFGSESDLFHNHDSDGSNIYRYPWIQYKVIQGSPMIVGIADGAKMLKQRFMRVEEIQIEDVTYPLESKQLSNRQHVFELGVKLHSYQFLSPWLALNQSNFEEYRAMGPIERSRRLERIFVGNVISLVKSVRFQVQERIAVKVNVVEVPIRFKGQRMLGFKGSFSTNILLPEHIGLGKSVARGFGAIGYSRKNRNAITS